jgi:hypothetical protein
VVTSAESHAHWSVYWQVTDPDASVAQVQALGHGPVLGSGRYGGEALFPSFVQAAHPSRE